MLRRDMQLSTLQKPPRRGITFLEIVCAMAILAFAAVPMIGIYWSTAVDADLANTAVFAQNIASNIMNASLDSVPFPCFQVCTSKISDLDGGNPEENVGRFAQIPSYDVASFLSLLGNKGRDTYARGELKDEKGTVYKVKLLVFPIPTKDVIDLDNELTFSWLPRPPFENAVGNSGRPSWFTDDSFVSREVVQLPYDMPIATNTQNAKMLGVPVDPGGTNTPMKKLLLKIRWKGPKKLDRNLEILALKANLSKDPI